jgi:DNA-binding CsgD family transcriptional regulator
MSMTNEADRLSTSCCCASQHLSGAELRIVEQLARGRTTTGIATALHVAPSTVANQIARMFEKFACANRVHLVSICYASGILAPGRWPPELAGRRCIPHDYGPASE